MALTTPADAALKHFLKALRLVQPAHLIYEFGHGDSLHVWLISPEFEDLDEDQRSHRVWPEFQKLPADVSLRVSLLFKLTPQEFREQYDLDPTGFPQPPGNEDGEGPYQIAA